MQSKYDPRFRVDWTTLTTPSFSDNMRLMPPTSIRAARIIWQYLPDPWIAIWENREKTPWDGGSLIFNPIYT